jgi:hypothetical protein
MQAVKEVPRNLFSRREHRPVTGWNVADYLGAFRSGQPWGTPERRSPLWEAATRAGVGFKHRVLERLADCDTPAGQWPDRLDRIASPRTWRA